MVRCWLTMRKVVSSTPVQGNLHGAGLAYNLRVFVSFRKSALEFMTSCINVFDVDAMMHMLFHAVLYLSC